MNRRALLADDVAQTWFAAAHPGDDDRAIVWPPFARKQPRDRQHASPIIRLSAEAITVSRGERLQLGCAKPEISEEIAGLSLAHGRGNFLPARVDRAYEANPAGPDYRAHGKQSRTDIHQTEDAGTPANA